MILLQKRHFRVSDLCVKYYGNAKRKEHSKDFKPPILQCLFVLGGLKSINGLLNSSLPVVPLLFIFGPVDFYF